MKHEHDDQFLDELKRGTHVPSDKIAQFVQELLKLNQDHELDESARQQMWQQALQRNKKHPTRFVHWLVVAAAVLLLFMIGIVTIIRSELKPVPSIANQPTPSGYISVVTATQPLSVGTQITAQMVTVVMWPADAALPGPTYSNPMDVIGLYVRGQTSQYMPVLQYNVTTETPPADDASVEERHI